MIDENGIVTKQSKRNTPNTIEEFYEEVLSMYNEIQNIQEVEGIALSMPGAVDSVIGTIGGSSALDYIHGPNIKQYISNKIGKPVEMENDANCAALAEVGIVVLVMFKIAYLL